MNIKTRHDFYNILLKDFKAALDHTNEFFIFLSNNKSFAPGGNNGPHYALETPIRNTCHWIVALLVGYKLFEDKIYLNKALSLSKWLLHENNCYRKGSYVMRQKTGGDWVNGVIGAAWILEALSRLWLYTRDNTALSLIKSIIDNHKYDDQAGGWCRYDPFVKKFSVDYTYDHQAWFAAALMDCDKKENVRAFLDGLNERNFQVNSQGRIFHLLNSKSIKGRLLVYKYKKKSKTNPDEVDEIENGYHLYSLYPLARLYTHFSDHEIFSSKAMQNALAYCTYDNLIKMNQSKFGFVYNAPGLELPLIYSVFKDRMPITGEQVLSIYNKQKELTFDNTTCSHINNNPDPLTMAARIYELAMYFELE